MRFLFIGDIVGAPGVALVKTAVPVLRQRDALAFVAANAENASGGSGVSPAVYRQLRSAGVDAVTLGDHIYKKFDIAAVLADPAEPACKPANFPPAAPGRDHILFEADGVPVAVISLLGRTFKVTTQRGVFVKSPLATLVLATVHPSSLLRVPDEKSRRRETRRFVSDLRRMQRAMKL